METTAVKKDRADKAEQKEELLLLNDETVAEKGATLKLLACENCNIKLNDNVYDSGSVRAEVYGAWNTALNGEFMEHRVTVSE